VRVPTPFGETKQFSKFDKPRHDNIQKNRNVRGNLIGQELAQMLTIVEFSSTSADCHFRRAAICFAGSIVMSREDWISFHSCVRCY